MRNITIPIKMGGRNTILYDDMNDSLLQDDDQSLGNNVFYKPTFEAKTHSEQVLLQALLNFPTLLTFQVITKLPQVIPIELLGEDVEIRMSLNIFSTRIPCEQCSRSFEEEGILNKIFSECSSTIQQNIKILKMANEKMKGRILFAKNKTRLNVYFSEGDALGNEQFNLKKISMKDEEFVQRIYNIETIRSKFLSNSLSGIEERRNSSQSNFFRNPGVFTYFVSSPELPQAISKAGNKVNAFFLNALEQL